jgi:hypothetical protein
LLLGCICHSDLCCSGDKDYFRSWRRINKCHSNPETTRCEFDTVCCWNRHHCPMPWGIFCRMLVKCSRNCSIISSTRQRGGDLQTFRIYISEDCQSGL